jgi:hypothetical protein
VIKQDSTAWRKLWPECVVNNPVFQEIHLKIQGWITEIGIQLSLELEPSDVEELLEAHTEELSTYNLF